MHGLSACRLRPEHEQHLSNPSGTRTQAPDPEDAGGSGVDTHISDLSAESILSALQVELSAPSQ
eukprot:633357-Prymnesium_polylepis.1